MQSRNTRPKGFRPSIFSATRFAFSTGLETMECAIKENRINQGRKPQTQHPVINLKLPRTSSTANATESATSRLNFKLAYNPFSYLLAMTPKISMYRRKYSEDNQPRSKYLQPFCLDLALNLPIDLEFYVKHLALVYTSNIPDRELRFVA